MSSTAVAGIAFLVVKYMDAIKAWLEKLCPACELEEDFVEEIEETVEEAVEEAVEEPAEIVVEEGTPVAEETDFAE